MRVLHICLNGPYTENWGYQENLISKFHARLGHNVSLIALTSKHADSGEIIDAEIEDYINENNVRVIRVPFHSSSATFFNRLFPKNDIRKIIEVVSPDLVMIHGLIGNRSVLQVKDYMKTHTNVRCVADIHEDSNNTIISRSKLKSELIRQARRYMNRLMFACYSRVYYVAPSCFDRALNYYGVPENLLELLPLGCDPELVVTAQKQNSGANLRKQLGITQSEIVVCHGGKLDSKKKTAEVIRAVRDVMGYEKGLRLIVFGSVASEYKRQINEELNALPYKAYFLGQLSQQEYHNVFAASDIAIFPGGQSVLWQQAIASGLALIAKHHEGVEYLDLGGNIRFLSSGNSKEIGDVLLSIINNRDYLQMKKVANEQGMQKFSYEKIAAKVLRDCFE